MGRLRKQEMGNAAGIYNLIRNIGGSIGIAALTAILVRGAQIHQNYHGRQSHRDQPGGEQRDSGTCRPVPDRGANAVLAHREALGALYGNLQQQAAVLAYADNFRLLGYLSLACIPLAFLLKRPRHEAAAEAIGE